MPSSSKKQHNFMAAVAHSKSFAKKVGVPQSVGKDFTEADKGRKMKRYASGGKVDWSANEANAMKPGEKQLGYGKPMRTPKSPKGKGSFNRDSITAEGRAKGVNFDKYGRVKAPSSVASDMVKKGAKFALDASPFGGIRKAGESVKKFLTTKSTKRPESVGKGGNVAKKYAEGGLSDSDTYNGTKVKDLTPEGRKQAESVNADLEKDMEEGRNKLIQARSGNSYSDEDEGSEQSKKNIADDKVAKSKAEDAKGKLNLSNKRGFFGSLLTGKIREYNAEHKRNRDLQSTFGKGFKSAATIDAEKERAKLDKPENKNKIDFDPSELKTGPDMEAHRKANKEQRQLRKSMKREEQGRKQQQSSSSSSSSSSGGESFGAWFKKQKEGTVQTWTNPKTGEKKRILISRTKPAASTSSAPAKKDDSKGITESSKNDFISRIATNLTKKKTATSSTPTKKSGWQTSNENFRKGQEAQYAAADSWNRKQKAKEDAAKKKKEAQKANFKPSANKPYNYCGGGSVKRYASGGMVSSRADGIASRGRTRCKIV